MADLRKMNGEQSFSTKGNKSELRNRLLEFRVPVPVSTPRETRLNMLGVSKAPVEVFGKDVTTMFTSVQPVPASAEQPACLRHAPLHIGKFVQGSLREKHSMTGSL